MPERSIAGVPAGLAGEGADCGDLLARGVIAWPAFQTESPYNRLLYRELADLGVPVEDFSPWKLLRSPPAVFHLHWPEAAIQVSSPLIGLVRGLVLLSLIRLARLRGSRIVWTVHNLHPHERPHPRLQSWFWRAFTRLVDGYIALSPSGARAAIAEFPVLRRRSGFVIPIAHYRGSYPDVIGRAESRARLGLPPSGPVYAFIGRIRPYKNVAHLVHTFRALENPEARLLVVGEPDTSETRRAVLEATAADSRVHLALAYVPDDEVQVYLRASDLVVLPFTEILNSSSAILALSFDRPALVPLAGAMGELRATAGPEWVRTFTGPLTPEELESSMAWARAVGRERCTSLDHLTWTEIARQTRLAYRQLVRSSARS
jgi:glycosyltransferase involved in cell wall biosynthesis